MGRSIAGLNSADLIAPCGINCRLCRAYGRERKPCAGCRAGEVFKSGNAIHCSLRCQKLASGVFRYCLECDEYPCARLLHLDKRYRTRYGTSPLENLRSIKAMGIRKFIRGENERWTCPQCGAMLCMHQPQCLACGYRWYQAH